MQSYLKYKAYYDRKAKASPLETTDYCYILNPKADTQATKLPFREFRWQGSYKVEKVLPNNNYIDRRLGTNETQLLHRIRLKKFTPQAPLADIFVRESDWQKDDQIHVAHDDLYAQSWNHGTQTLDLTHSRVVPQITRKTMMMSNTYLLKYLKITTLKFPEKGGGAQWCSPLRAKKKIMSKYHKKFVIMKQKAPKKPQKKIHQEYKPKKPQKIPERPHCKKNP